ncbi:MAG: GNAT family N-acetyltransferase [Kofleriaceae bacterium]|nr:GNAT family N-acetyltransferase [Kofleriaceae bacterium]MBP6837014.1 GNAT family N-acetyltransferase [Kofleriaceae bacterium]
MIYRGNTADHDWAAHLGAEVYASLGNYAQILSAWLDQPGVSLWIEGRAVGDRRGLAMLGYVADEAGQVVADLLALAVEPAWQRRGIGGALLAHVIRVAERSAGALGVERLGLTVVHDNWVGRRMYERAGFVVADAEVGSYAGGQRAVHMVRPLRADGAAWPRTLTARP